MGEIPLVNTTDRYSKLCEEYNDIFEGIGKLRGVQVELYIDETVQPVQNRHRRIPYHTREKVQEELVKLEQFDIIEKAVAVQKTNIRTEFSCRSVSKCYPNNATSNSCRHTGAWFQTANLF